MEESGRTNLSASVFEEGRQCELVEDTDGGVIPDLWKWFIIKPDLGNFRVQVFQSPVTAQWQKRL